MNEKTPGQIAFEAFYKTSHWRLSGNRQLWEQTAQAVLSCAASKPYLDELRAMAAELGYELAPTGTIKRFAAWQQRRALAEIREIDAPRRALTRQLFTHDPRFGTMAK